MKEDSELKYLVTSPEWFSKILDILSTLETKSAKPGVQLENVWTRDELKIALQKQVPPEDFDRLVSYLVELNILVDMGADSLLPAFLLKQEYDQKLVNNKPIFSFLALKDFL